MDLLGCVKLEVPADDFAGWQQALEMAGLFGQTLLYNRVKRWYGVDSVVLTISHAAP